MIDDGFYSIENKALSDSNCDLPNIHMEEVYEIPFSDDDIYYSDDSYSDEVKSNLYNVLEKYMDISNISNDCDLSYDLTEVEVNENEPNNYEVYKK